jgi:folylpolyglutamate synthase/dihydrofolate synthase
MELGLERIHNLLKALGNPEKQLKAIHVAGTNGKGSVCAYIASILSLAGFKVGRYNSPHFLEPTDAIKICGENISKSEYEKLCDRVATVDKENRFGASTFELSTAAALLWFYESCVDFAVIEVGLGGALDATNVFNSPAVSVITPIGMDHAGILGNSIEEIATAKAGIMKAKCPVVISPQSEDAAMDVLVRRANELGCPMILSPTAAWCSKAKDRGWATLTVRFPDNAVDTTYQIRIPLYGDHQRVNAATAVCAIHMLKHTLPDPGSKITMQSIQDGMASTRWPGRLDLLTKEQHPWLKTVYGIDEMFVDGAHNPPAAKALREFVDQQLKIRHLHKVHWILASTQGKDIMELLNILLRPEDSVYTTVFTQPENMPWIHSMEPSEIKGIAAAAVTGNCTTHVSLNDALHAVGQADHSDELIVLCGSLYLVADLYRLHRQVS